MAGKDMIEMSQGELTRLHVIHKAIEGLLKQTEAAEMLLLTQKMHLAGGQLTEKSFAATPLTCHDGILEVHKIMQETFENFIMAFDKILLKSKDFDGDYAPAC